MMNDHLQQFSRHLEFERGYSAHTVAAYGRIAEDFLSFLSRVKVKLRRLGRDHLQAYVAYLRQERHNDSGSIRMKLQVIKAFLAFLTQQLPNAAPKLPLGSRDFGYKTEQKDVETLSQEQLAILLQALLDCRTEVQRGLETTEGKTTLWRKRLFAARRDVALVTLFMSTGVRIAEALNIRLSDVDFVDRSILIHGKGKKLRKVFFDLRALSAHLLPYIEARRELDVDHDYLFVGIKSYAPLHSRGFQKRLKDYLHKAGLRRSITPHSLRHSFATVAIEKGANIKAVSQILGHANCKITIDLYTHLSSEHLRAVMQRCNPLSEEVISIEERIEMRKKHLPYLDRTG